MSLIDAINSYIQVGRDVNSHDKTGNTFLHYAILENNLVAIDLLLQNGAIIDAKNSDGVPPLLTAVKKGNKDIVDLIKLISTDSKKEIYKNVLSIRQDT